MKSASRKNLRLHQPDGGSPADDAISESAWSDADLTGLEAWLLSDSSASAFSGRDAPSNLGGLSSLCAASESAVSFSERAEGVLRAAVDGLGCASGALYLLDDATTELAMRSMSGLPPSRLIEDARPLRGAIADLEAMCGHAVVLEDPLMNAHWRVPEPCGAAVCLPVSTGSTVLGTLWFFYDAPREIDAKTTNLMEIVAGRLAVEVELDALREARRDGLWAWTGADRDACD